MRFRGIVAGSRANTTSVGSSLFRQAVQTLSLQLRSWRSFVAVALYPRHKAAAKFENRISCVHDVAIVRHNNEGVAPVPACLTQQSHYVSCVLVVQISDWLISEDKNWVRVLCDGWQTTLKTALKKRGQLRRSPSSASKPEAVAG